MSISKGITSRLSIMMFLQFFIWGGWFVTLGTFLGNNLNATDGQIGMAFSTQSWGAIIAHSNNGILPRRPLERFNDVKLFSYTNTYQLKRVLDKRRIEDNEKMHRNLWADEKLNRLAAIIRRYYSDAKKLANKEPIPKASQ